MRSPRVSTKTGRPIMMLLDLLGRRWALRIIWELRRKPLTSRALREACDDLSPVVLHTRLRELRDAGLVEHQPQEGFRLTELGAEMLATFMPLHHFADRWARQRPQTPK